MQHPRYPRDRDMGTTSRSRGRRMPVQIPVADQGTRTRLLVVGKTLFAQRGYEQTSTSAISRQAGTSESQLMRHFEGKRGLLAAIFDDGWRMLNQQVHTAVAGSGNAVEAMDAMLNTVIKAFERDEELACVLLLEGRRIHCGEHGVVLSQGYLEFINLLQRLVGEAQAQAARTAALNSAAVSSALVGAAEGMIRDRLIALQSAHRPGFSLEDVERIFRQLIGALVDQPKTGIRAMPKSVERRRRRRV